MFLFASNVTRACMTKIRIIRFKHIPTDDRNINFIVLFNSKDNLLVYVIKDVKRFVETTNTKLEAL